MAEKKPEAEAKFSQEPAQGDQDDDAHATDVEAEAAAHGYTPNVVGGHGQGGAGH